MTESPTRRPTRFSIAVVALVTLLTLAALVVRMGQTDRARVGVLAGATMAGTLWGLDRDRGRWVALAGGTVAVPVVGGSLLVGVVTALAAQFRTAEPVGTVLLIVVVAVGVLGALTTVGDCLDRAPLSRIVGAAAPAVAVPGLVLLVLALTRFLPVGRQVGAAVAAVLGVLLDPVPGRVHLGIWLFLAVTAVASVRAAVAALPVAELLTDDWPAPPEPLSLIRTYATAIVVVLAGVALSLVLFEAVGRPYAGLPSGLRRVFADVTASAPLRVVLVLATGVSLVVLAVAASVRRGYQASGGRLLGSVAPVSVALGLCWYALAAGDAAVETVRMELARRLPPVARDPALTALDRIAAFFGADLLALTAVLVAAIVGAIVVIVLYLAVGTGRVPRRSGGPALASAGLFATAGIGVVQGLALPVGLGGAVASLLVWDAGSFGATLGEELGGTVGSARTEVVHLGATLTVGALSSALAVGIASRLGDRATGTSVVAALVGAVVGALLLVIASR